MVEKMGEEELGWRGVFWNRYMCEKEQMGNSLTVESALHPWVWGQVRILRQQHHKTLSRATQWTCFVFKGIIQENHKSHRGEGGKSILLKSDTLIGNKKEDEIKGEKATFLHLEFLTNNDHICHRRKHGIHRILHRPLPTESSRKIYKLHFFQNCHF